MRICKTEKYIVTILLIVLYVQDVYSGCIKIRKSGKNKAKEKQIPKNDDSKTCHKPDNWPNTAAAESFPEDILDGVVAHWGLSSSGRKHDWKVPPTGFIADPDHSWPQGRLDHVVIPRS